MIVIAKGYIKDRRDGKLKSYQQGDVVDWPIEYAKQHPHLVDVFDEKQTAPNATKSAIDYAVFNGIDINSVVGTGAGGKVTLSDVKKVK